MANPVSKGGVDTYRLELAQYSYSFHPDLKADTTLWGYADITGGGAPNHRYLGGVIVARKNRPVSLTVVNKLPSIHPLPVDTTLAGAEPGQPVNRATTHLHGGFTPWTSDGGPFSWFTPNGLSGPSFLNGTGVAGEARYYYPNQQSARFMWYHDHAMGTTRLNAYAGIASAYLLRDSIEDELVSAQLIPSYTYEVPLIIQDKTFVNGTDHNYTWGKKGDLWYPYLYENSRWDYGPNVTPPSAVDGPLPVPSCVPEFFGDTSIVNGVAYPYLNVEQRHYRFRILNGSQARFYNLQLYYADSSGLEANLNRLGPDMIQIGTEGGFLPWPVRLNNARHPVQITFDANGNAATYNLLLAPAERADVIVDFSAVPAGSKLILYNDAPAPFPGGDTLNDYFTGNPDQTPDGGAPTTLPGYGPNSRTLMQFNVVARSGAADAPTMSVMSSIALPNVTNLPTPKVGNPLPAVTALAAGTSSKTRDLTLNEVFDDRGRLIQMLGTNLPCGMDLQGAVTFARPYMSDPTEVVRAGSTETWRLFNLTGDTHPIHFHLVNVQVVSRQPFDVDAYLAAAAAAPTTPVTPTFTGPAQQPDANEWGYKETVRMNPGECTTVIMKFDLPTVSDVPASPRFASLGKANEYVWHCHILEHEEHDMMRPLVVIG